MPFDVLPRHQINLPPVQFYHPSPEYARIALESAQMRYAAIMHGIDSVLNAADPMNIAERRLAMAEMPLKFKQLEYQTQFLKARSDWMQQHPDEPWFPQNYNEAIAARKYGYMKRDQGAVDEALNPGGVGGTPSANRTTPPYFPKVVPTPGVLREPQVPTGTDLEQPPFSQQPPAGTPATTIQEMPDRMTGPDTADTESAAS